MKVITPSRSRSTAAPVDAAPVDAAPVDAAPVDAAPDALARKIQAAARDVEHVAREARRWTINAARRYAVDAVDSRGVLDGTRISTVRKAFSDDFSAKIKAASSKTEQDKLSADKAKGLAILKLADAFTFPGMQGALFDLLRSREAVTE